MLPSPVWAKHTVILQSPRISFEVVERTAEYEERLYPEINWVCISKPGVSRLSELAITDLFFTMNNYFLGENTTGQNLVWSSPVLFHFDVDAKDMPDQKKVTIAAPLLDLLEPPEPLNKDIYICKSGMQRMITRTLTTAKLEDEAIQAELEHFASLFDEDSSVITTNYCIVGYDPPFINKRHREIWFKRVVVP